MRRAPGKRSLEAYKIFPYVAWGLTFGFALFVYNIVTQLQDITVQLQAQTNALQQQVAADPHTADFDDYGENRYQENNRPQ